MFVGECCVHFTPLATSRCLMLSLLMATVWKHEVLIVGRIRAGRLWSAQLSTGPPKESTPFRNRGSTRTPFKVLPRKI
eukprot:4968069-Amphidinium_carterae.1